MATLLLIDDDDLLRRALIESLVKAGHKVIEASDGLQGCELARSLSVDLVITDLVMPVQEGVETIMTLRRERPRLPIIAMSGGVTHSKLYPEIAGKIGAKRMLPKPFLPRALLALIDEILTEEAQRDPSAEHST
jgi:two-component system chemotaxis response regulator CheY